MKNKCPKWLYAMWLMIAGACFLINCQSGENAKLEPVATEEEPPQQVETRPDEEPISSKQPEDVKDSPQSGVLDIVKDADGVGTGSAEDDIENPSIPSEPPISELPVEFKPQPPPPAPPPAAPEEEPHQQVETRPDEEPISSEQPEDVKDSPPYGVLDMIKDATGVGTGSAEVDIEEPSPPSQPPIPESPSEVLPAPPPPPVPPAPVERPQEKPKEQQYPEFPWPPPKASVTTVIPNDQLQLTFDRVLYLSEVNQKLSSALEECGYFETSYYSVPDGFAMVTRLEQIQADGTPIDDPDRWVLGIIPLKRFSLSAYLKSLFKANQGYYRIIVFVITSRSFSQSDTKVSRQEAIEWSVSGMNTLPHSIAKMVYTNKHSCTALIYEFERPASGEKPLLTIPGRLTGRRHLENSQIWNALRSS